VLGTYEGESDGKSEGSIVGNDIVCPILAEPDDVTGSVGSVGIADDDGSGAVFSDALESATGLWSGGLVGQRVDAGLRVGQRVDAGLRVGQRVDAGSRVGQGELVWSAGAVAVGIIVSVGKNVGSTGALDSDNDGRTG
jgi:hypothetical protein